jgi:hypothetical protein
VAAAAAQRPVATGTCCREAAARCVARCLRSVPFANYPVHRWPGGTCAHVLVPQQC